MKKTIRYILLFALCISSVGINAQSLSNVERRKMYMDVLNLINNYEKYAEVDSRNKRSFLRLFNDPATPIYNDLMGVSESETMPAHEYADSMVSQAKYPEVVIRNVLHDEPQYTDGKWYMNVSFTKELEYMDSCGIFEFSSKKHYGVDHQIKARVSWTDSDGAKFELFEGFIDTYVDHYPVNYMIFEPRNPKDTTYLLFKGNPIITEYYDGNAYAILPKAGTKDFKYTKDKDVHAKLMHDVNNKVYMTYKSKRWRVKARYEQALAAIAVEKDPKFGYKDKTITSLEWGNKNLMGIEADFKFNNDNQYVEREKSYDLEQATSVRALGLDLGYIFPSKGCVKWGFFTGAALRQTSLNVTYNNGSNTLKINRLTPTEDIDGDTYLRKYEFSYLQYKTKVNELYFPVYFDMDIRCSSHFSLYFDFGAKVYWSFMNPVTAFSADYKVTGLYPQYGGVEFDETFFGDYKLNGFVNNGNISETIPHERDKSSVYLDAFAGLGFRVRVYKDLYIDLGCNYQHNVGDIVSAFQKKGWISNVLKYILEEDWNYLINNKGTVTDPLNYNLDKGVEEVTNVADYYKSIDRRNAFQFNVGLMFRF